MASIESQRTLGWVLVAWAMLGVLGIAGLVVLFSAPWFEGDTWNAPSLRSPLAFVAGVGLAGATLSLVAGIGLLRGTRWSRPVAFLASIASLPTMPVGTVIGVYGLLVLLGKADSSSLPPP